MWAMFQRGQQELDVCEGAEWDTHPQVVGLVEDWLQWTRTNRYIRTKVISVSERTARTICLWGSWVGYPIPILKSLVLWRPHHNEQGPIITLEPKWVVFLMQGQQEPEVCEAAGWAYISSSIWSNLSISYGAWILMSFDNSFNIKCCPMWYFSFLPVSSHFPLSSSSTSVASSGFSGGGANIVWR